MELTNLHQKILLCIQKSEGINLNDEFQATLFTVAGDHADNISTAIRELEDERYIEHTGEYQIVSRLGAPPEHFPPLPKKFTITEKGVSALRPAEEIIDSTDIDDVHKDMLKQELGG